MHEEAQNRDGVIKLVPEARHADPHGRRDPKVPGLAPKREPSEARNLAAIVDVPSLQRGEERAR